MLIKIKYRQFFKSLLLYFILKHLKRFNYIFVKFSYNILYVHIATLGEILHNTVLLKQYKLNDITFEGSQ